MTIDNPTELEMLDDEEQDDDPDVLDEIDRRQEEIIEQFMELSVNIKHELRDKLTEEVEKSMKEDDPDASDDEIELAVNKKLKEMKLDAKRKDGLKVLKARINEIVTDEELNAVAKLQKLYEEVDVNEFTQEMMA